MTNRTVIGQFIFLENVFTIFDQRSCAGVRTFLKIGIRTLYVDVKTPTCCYG